MYSNLGSQFEIIDEIWVMFPKTPLPFNVFTDGEQLGLAYRYPDDTHTIILDCLYDDIQYVEQASTQLILVKSHNKWGAFKLIVSSSYHGTTVDAIPLSPVIYDDLCFIENITVS